MEGLELFAPEPRRVALRSGPVEVLPLRMRQLPGFAKAVEPVAGHLAAGAFAAAILADFEAVRRALSIGSGLTEEQIDDLLPDECADLAAAVVEVNLDFFARSVLPRVTAHASALRGRIAALAGPRRSPGSASGATGSETSST